jgi:hypothetical protein
MIQDWDKHNCAENNPVMCEECVTEMMDHGQKMRATLEHLAVELAKMQNIINAILSPAHEQRQASPNDRYRLSEVIHRRGGGPPGSPRRPAGE